MIISLYNDINNDYESLISNIIYTYVSMLNNTFSFERKIQMLKVGVYKERKSHTNGITLVKSGKEYNIDLFINENDDQIFSAFVIAHECTHLLFASTINILMSGYCSIDDSFEVTSVKRQINGIEYGAGLEEMLADYIAVEVVRKYYIKCKHLKLNYKELVKKIYSYNISGFSEENYYMIKKFVKLFGSDIREYDKIDSYSKDQSKVFPNNLLLYTAVTGSINILINDYCECMGKYAWKNVNEALDIFFADNTNKDAKKYLLSEIKRFKSI